ncbi:MAG: aminoacyl-tRNA hydrolase [Aestuariivirgaceae bacterium]
MLLFVGLGNPGAQYALNRHNIGFMAVDAIASRHRFSPWRRKFQGVVAEGILGGMKIIALKPGTYMNESGRSVGEAMRYFQCDSSDVYVFHDELDLLSGKVRVKTGGGTAGHNGIRSIDAHIGSGFHRVRLGIGHPGERHRVYGHVLGDFAKSDKDWLGPLLDAVAEHAGLLATGGEASFQNKIHLALNPVDKTAANGAKETP